MCILENGTLVFGFEFGSTQFAFWRMGLLYLGFGLVVLSVHFGGWDARLAFQECLIRL